MGLFNIFKKKKQVDFSLEREVITVDIDGLKGKDFEFLIKGNIEIPNDQFDILMTPNSFNWNKIVKEDWEYYVIDSDEYSYSIEPPGIQMVFNDEIEYIKAKKIVDEVIDNLTAVGHSCEVVVINKSTIYKF